MKVAIITTPEEDYHKHFCAMLARRYDVVGIIHPQRAFARSGLLDLNAHRRSIARFGLPYHILQKLGANKFKALGWDLGTDIAAAEAEFFPTAETDYARLQDRARNIVDINGPEGVRCLQSLNADVAVVSGGPIYKEPFLQAVPLMINYHTGISPLYNGSESIFWPYINGHPHVTGGTLMVMNAGVDAGDILAHYLPTVEPGDTPGRLFMKTLQGGFNLYCRFLDHLIAGQSYTSAPQGRPFHYTVSSEWSVHQNLMLERRVRHDICAKASRSLEIDNIYWDLGNRHAATSAVRTFLGEIVYDIQDPSS